MSHFCKTAVISCIDFRFWDKLTEFVKKSENCTELDLINLAGGAKNLIEEQTREIVFKQLDVCTGLHKVRKLYLVNHIDCGAYGGSKAFSSALEERKRLIDDLFTAKEFILNRYPQLNIELLLQTFENVEKVAQSACL